MKYFISLWVSIFLSCVLGAESIKLSAYVFPYSLTENAPIVLSTTDPESWSNGYGLFFDENGLPSAYVAGTNSIAILQGSVIPTNTWSHLSLEITHSEALFFIEGTLEECLEIAFAGSTNADLIIADDGFVKFDGKVRLDEYYQNSLETIDKIDKANTKSVKFTIPKQRKGTKVSTIKQSLKSQSPKKEVLGKPSTYSTKEISGKISLSPLFSIHSPLE